MTKKNKKELPPIPDKRYFTISEVSKLCGVKPHVLRYWGQEFSRLKPVRRRGNRRYYQRHDIELVRHIDSLLYESGFTISGARQYLEKHGSNSQPKSNHEKKELIKDLLAELEEIHSLLSV